MTGPDEGTAIGGWYSASVAVPGDRSSEAVLALHATGYDARLTDQEAREEHPGYVVISTRRYFADDDGGRRNSEELKAALFDESIPCHLYSHSGASLGGSSVHKWSDVFTVGGRPLGLKVLVATPSDEDSQLSSVAEILGIDRDLLVVDPPEYSLRRLRPEPEHEVVSKIDVEYRQASEGLESAIDRFEKARRSRDAGFVVPALTEVLTWTVALDDWHARQHQTESPEDQPYRVRRSDLDTLDWIAASRTRQRGDTRAS